MDEDLTTVSERTLEQELYRRRTMRKADILAKHSRHSVEELMSEDGLYEDALEEASNSLWPRLQAAKKQLSDLNSLDFRLKDAARDLQTWHDYPAE